MGPRLKGRIDSRSPGGVANTRRIVEQDLVFTHLDQQWPHGIHVWPVYISAGLPEAALAIEDLAAFLRHHARQDDAQAEVR